MYESLSWPSSPPLAAIPSRVPIRADRSQLKIREHFSKEMKGVLERGHAKEHVARTVLGILGRVSVLRFRTFQDNGHVQYHRIPLTSLSYAQITMASASRYCPSCLSSLSRASSSQTRTSSTILPAFLLPVQSQIQVRTAVQSANAAKYKRKDAPASQRRKKAKSNYDVPDLKNAIQFSLVDAMRYGRKTLLTSDRILIAIQISSRRRSRPQPYIIQIRNSSPTENTQERRSSTKPITTPASRQNRSQNLRDS